MRPLLAERPLELALQRLLSDTEEVTGSSPVSPTSKAAGQRGPAGFVGVSTSQDSLQIPYSNALGARRLPVAGLAPSAKPGIRVLSTLN